MSVPSSTSSSDQRLPRLAWPRVLGGALLIFAAFVGSMELRLAARGFRPTVIDSAALWLKERQRASDLGARALILVGASRIQLDIDLDLLRRRTGLEPVQLAVDGSSFVPVLRSLADDPAVHGTVIVSFADHILAGPPSKDTAARFAAEYKSRRPGQEIPDFATIEAYLTDLLHHQLRSYADGARPITSLLLRILPPRATPQYLVTLPDRSRLADYRRVPMPRFYYARVERNLGQTVRIVPGMSWDDLDAVLRARIEALKPADNATYLRRIQAVVAMASAIEARGGHVVFVAMPRSGLVKLIDDHRFPRRMFWDRFAASSLVPAVHFEDVPGLRDFVCPDGSHLDYRERDRFTRALVAAFGLDKTNAGAIDVAAATLQRR